MTIVHTAKNRFALLASIIAIGVLVYSPLCSLSCAASDCYLMPRTKKSEEKKQPGHCHQHKEAENHPAESPSPSNAPEPERHRDSGDCPAHMDGIAILSSIVKARAAVSGRQDLRSHHLP